MDLKEFDVSEKGNRYALVYLDYLTKCPEIEIERPQHLPVVQQIWCGGIIHDRASEFLSDILQDTAHSSYPRITAATNISLGIPRLMVNKAVKLNNVNELFGKKGHNWDTLLRPVLMAYHTTPQVSIGESHFTYSTVGMQNCLLLSIIIHLK